MKHSSGNRWQIIFIATIFNLLFEYSLRGVNNLAVQPFLPFLLFAIYFTLFTLVEDLIIRFKLKDYQLMLLSFFYGTIYCAWTSGLVFLPPLSAGDINWSALLYVNIIWWGALQAVLTFYLANMLFPRDWNHSRLSKIGWTLCLFVQFFALYLFQKSGLIPNGTPLGKRTIGIILCVTFLVFITSIKNSRPGIVSFRNSVFLNSLAFVTIVLFGVCSLFLTKDPIYSGTSNVNATSLKIVSIWTFILAVAILVYRVGSKKEISI